VDTKSAIEFCKSWCGELTREQQIMVETAVKKNTFLGVGRAIGRSVYWPAVHQMKWNVIDTSGHLQLASTEGRKLCPLS